MTIVIQCVLCSNDIGRECLSCSYLNQVDSVRCRRCERDLSGVAAVATAVCKHCLDLYFPLNLELEDPESREGLPV